MNPIQFSSEQKTEGIGCNWLFALGFYFLNTTNNLSLGQMSRESIPFFDFINISNYLAGVGVESDRVTSVQSVPGRE